MVGKRMSVLLAAAIVSTSACQTDRVSGPEAITPNLAAQSGGVETNVSIPITLGVFVPCANGGSGEVIVVSGFLHYLFNVTIDARGGFHVKQHNQPQGLSGVGLTTCDKYQGTGVTQYSENLSPGVTYSYVNNFRMIGQGPGNNYLVHENYHVTINANGELTTTHDNISIECK